MEYQIGDIVKCKYGIGILQAPRETSSYQFTIKIEIWKEPIPSWLNLAYKPNLNTKNIYCKITLEEYKKLQLENLLLTG